MTEPQPHAAAIAAIAAIADFDARQRMPGDTVVDIAALVRRLAVSGPARRLAAVPWWRVARQGRAASA